MIRVQPKGASKGCCLDLFLKYLKASQKNIPSIAISKTRYVCFSSSKVLAQNSRADEAKRESALNMFKAVEGKAAAMAFGTKKEEQKWKTMCWKKRFFPKLLGKKDAKRNPDERNLVFPGSCSDISRIVDKSSRARSKKAVGSFGSRVKDQ